MHKIIVITLTMKERNNTKKLETRMPFRNTNTLGIKEEMVKRNNKKSVEKEKRKCHRNTSVKEHDIWELNIMNKKTAWFMLKFPLRNSSSWDILKSDNTSCSQWNCSLLCSLAQEFTPNSNTKLCPSKVCYNWGLPTRANSP